jgi:hypothetical protein
MITVPAMLGRIRRRLAARPERLPLDLNRRTPVSREFGYERGRPVDRSYIERFLKEHSQDVRGRVLEVAEDTYTQWYGGDRVTHSDVLYAAAGNPAATVVGDLTTGEGIPAGAYDCFILTQTLHIIYDVPAALRGTRAALADRGVLLATLPGISQISRADRRDWGDYWRFTSDSVRRLFAEAYGEGNFEVRAHGNVLTASAFLYGLAMEDLSDADFAYDDPDFEMLMTVRAVKR